MREKKDMLNFTVGPVMASDEICRIGAEQVPYFRTDEFSKIMKENETLVKRFSGAEDAGRVVFLTGSGTAAMEAAVINTLTKDDKVLIVNGGGFGQRFVDLCEIHKIPYTEIRLEKGKKLTEQDLYVHNHKDFTAFVVNVHETSTGVYYDMNIISEFCKNNDLFLIVDAISSFLADPFDMKALGVDVMIAGSQKALACPPGVSFVVLSDKALRRIDSNEPSCLYLNLKVALKDGERGQTPFTPAVGILRQINARLREIEKNGGVEHEISKIQLLAKNFRERILELPFVFFSESMSNAMTALHPTTASAYDIFITLKDEYNIWICPNGGELKDCVCRVGHIGNLTLEDNDRLIDALKDMRGRGII